MIFAIIILIGSIFLLNYSSEKVLKNLVIIAQYLNWREFVTSFLLIALASSLPNLWTGIISALKGIPLLSFGDIAGNNVIVLSVGIGLATLFSSKGVPTKSRTINFTSLFTLITSLILILLMLDKKLTRFDGLILIGCFLFYLIWLFSDKERFTLLNQEINNQNNLKTGELIEKEINKFIGFLKRLFVIFFFFFFLLLSAYGIVFFAQKISYYLSFSLMFLGILITGIGNALPEISVAITSARKNQEWVILGDLLGSVFMLSVLVLSIVILINPIFFDFTNFSFALLSRGFISLLSLVFYLFSLTDGILTKKEGLILICFYFVFLYFILANIL
ncbi:MAG: sodium:calcium antiporter [Minisyncoccia bacterium]